MDEVTIIGRAALPWPERKRVEVELYDEKKAEKTVFVRELGEDEFGKCQDMRNPFIYNVISDAIRSEAVGSLGDCVVSAVRLYDGKRIAFENYNEELINIVGHGKK